MKTYSICRVIFVLDFLIVQIQSSRMKVVLLLNRPAFRMKGLINREKILEINKMSFENRIHRKYLKFFKSNQTNNSNSKLLKSIRLFYSQRMNRRFLKWKKPSRIRNKFHPKLNKFLTKISRLSLKIIFTPNQSNRKMQKISWISLSKNRSISMILVWKKKGKRMKLKSLIGYILKGS